MRYFPCFVDTQSLQCLIVGAGEVAARKTELMLKTHASIKVIAPEAVPTMQRLMSTHGLAFEQRKFKDSDLDKVDIVFVATDKPDVNVHISQLAKQQNIQVNVVDSPEDCTFVTPAIIERTPVTIAMCSGGVAPVLLRHLRQKLEALIPQRISQLGQFANTMRDKVKAKFSTIDARRNFWEAMFEGPVGEDVLNGNEQRATERLLAQLDETEDTLEGEVYLVGSGPGDPELLTFKALRLMQKADVVVYDRLVSEPILNMVRRDAEKIYVGKAKSKHTIPQSEINQVLVDQAKMGKRVVRLKGGDPFIFGRGGEELSTLVANDIPFQVVPGITAANGASSYAGIPLTHRDHAQAVVFATGHLQDNTINLNWKSLATPNHTLVFYMGLTGLEVITRELVNHGLASDTPIALIESATTSEQVVVTGTLSTIQQVIAEHPVKPPTLIIIGSVVTLRDELNWFSQQFLSEIPLQNAL